MSKKSSADVSEPSNALIMRTLNTMNARFDRLPTVKHLNKLESELHSKLEANTKALKNELRAEFRAEMDEQANKLTNMIAEVREQVQSGAATSSGRSDAQKGRYLRARRSFKIWPVEIEHASK